MRDPVDGIHDSSWSKRSEIEKEFTTGKYAAYGLDPRRFRLFRDWTRCTMQVRISHHAKRQAQTWMYQSSRSKSYRRIETYGEVQVHEKRQILKLLQELSSSARPSAPRLRTRVLYTTAGRIRFGVTVRTLRPIGIVPRLVISGGCFSAMAFRNGGANSILRRITVRPVVRIRCRSLLSLSTPCPALLGIRLKYQC